MWYFQILLKNIENRKILYSKSFAALNSKGKYIIQLDQDDLFIRDDVFDILYNEAEKEDLDLVQIRDICMNNLVFKKLTRVNLENQHKIYSKKTHYKKQPELKDKMFYDENNYLLWGLLNYFALIHLFHSNSASHDFFKDNNCPLSILFFGISLFDYHINKHPRDIEIFTHYYHFFNRAFNKGKKLSNFFVSNFFISFSIILRKISN